MVLDAVFTEGMQTVERLGVLVGFEADLAAEELIVDLLGEPCARRRRHVELVKRAGERRLGGGSRWLRARRLLILPVLWMRQ